MDPQHLPETINQDGSGMWLDLLNEYEGEDESSCPFVQHRILLQTHTSLIKAWILPSQIISTKKLSENNELLLGVVPI